MPAMAISPQQWLTAFVVAVALHVLAGALVWLPENAPEPPRPSPRGVMVSLDALSAGNRLQPSEAPQPVTAVAAPSANAVPATPAVQQPSAVAPAPAQAVAPEATAPERIAPELGDLEPIAPEPVNDALPAPEQVDPDPTVPEPVDPAAERSAPDQVQPPQAAADAAIPSAGDVDVAVADAVTVEAADAIDTIAQAGTVTTIPPRPSAQQDQGVAAPGLSKNPTESYIGRMLAWFARHKYYPAIARRSGVEGTVRLYVVIDRNGQVLSISVARSSGSAVLDQAARDMVRRSEPLPPMSDDMQRTRLEIIVPVVFSLGGQGQSAP